MSGRFVFRRPPALARSVVAATVMLACGLGVLPATAQPPTQGSVEAIDDRPPLPPSEPNRKPTAAKYRIPNPDRAIFTGTKDRYGIPRGGIEDEKPLASEKQNSNEYNAWTEFVLHARQFTAAELEQHAARDLTPDDLTFPIRKYFRLDLIGFEGKLTKVRRVRATRALEDIGVKEVFEGWLVPVNESPINPVCIVFLELPADLPKVPERAEGEAAGDPIELDRWVRFAGFFFKLMLYPGPDADPANPLGAGWKKTPLLVGKSVTLLPASPVSATGVLFTEEQKNLRIYKLIRDDAPMPRDDNLWEELAAWNRVVLRAHRFTPSELENEARNDLTFADLFTDGRLDYKLDLVKFKGRLIRLKKGESTRRLLEAGIPVWYEGWLVPNNEPSGHPVCIVMTDLPPGLEPKASMDRYVSFAGYYFKKMHYESGERRKDDPSRNVWKGAPLLIGRSVTLIEEQDVTSGWSEWFFPGIAAGVVFIVGAALILTWWYRSGDRKAREEIAAVRGQNPFGSQTG